MGVRALTSRTSWTKRERECAREAEAFGICSLAKRNEPDTCFRPFSAIAATHPTVASIGRSGHLLQDGWAGCFAPTAVVPGSWVSEMEIAAPAAKAGSRRGSPGIRLVQKLRITHQTQTTGIMGLFWCTN